jgi:hypothetical protein
LVPQGFAHPIGRFAGQRRHDVRVDVGGGSHLRVPQQFHHDARVNSGGQEQSRRRVPAVVEPDFADL